MFTTQHLRIEYRGEDGEAEAIDALDAALTTLSEIAEMHLATPREILVALAPGIAAIMREAERECLGMATAAGDHEEWECHVHTAGVFAGAISDVTLAAAEASWD